MDLLEIFRGRGLTPVNREATVFQSLEGFHRKMAVSHQTLPHRLTVYKMMLWYLDEATVTANYSYCSLIEILESFF